MSGLYYGEINDNLRELGKLIRENSERWFPQLHDGTTPLMQFYALGLAGEAGEVANEVKKLWRKVGGDRSKLGAELADVFTYLLLLANEAGIDLIDEYLDKVKVNNARWGEPA